MSTLACSEKKTRSRTASSCGLPRPVPQSSSPISPSAPWRWSKSKCRRPSRAPSPPRSARPSAPCAPTPPSSPFPSDPRAPLESPDSLHDCQVRRLRNGRRAILHQGLHQAPRIVLQGFQLGITFASGYIAGVFCALISQPADNLVSQMGKAENKGRSFGELAAEQGVQKLFMQGLGTRVIMIGTLTGLQWWIYDTWKTFCGLGTSGGASVKK